VARQFEVAQPDQVWTTDITYLWTAAGWLYLAVVLDLFARKVVGWAMSEHIDAVLVHHALVMALGRRQPPEGLIHHIEMFYNSSRKHSYLGYISPNEYETLTRVA
jgi:putative transposase